MIGLGKNQRRVLLRLQTLAMEDYTVGCLAAACCLGAPVTRAALVGLWRRRLVSRGRCGVAAGYVHVYRVTVAGMAARPVAL